jgi:hypothetical protein
MYAVTLKALMVLVRTESGEALEEGQEAWLKLSHRPLARAYSDDESDYSGRVGKMSPAE